MINARRVERAGASNDPVDFVALLKQQIRQITSVLARNAGDECLFHLLYRVAHACARQLQHS